MLSPPELDFEGRCLENSLVHPQNQNRNTKPNQNKRMSGICSMKTWQKFQHTNIVAQLVTEVNYKSQTETVISCDNMTCCGLSPKQQK